MHIAQQKKVAVPMEPLASVPAHSATRLLGWCDLNELFKYLLHYL